MKPVRAAIAATGLILPLLAACGSENQRMVRNDEYGDRRNGSVRQRPLGTSAGLVVFGVEPERQVRVTTIGDNVIAGSFARLRTTADGIILGRGVADVLGANMDDLVSLSGPTGGRATC